MSFKSKSSDLCKLYLQGSQPWKGCILPVKCPGGRRGLVVKASDFHAGGRGFDSRSGQAAQ